MNRKSKYEVRREAFELVKDANVLNREDLIDRLNKVSGLVESAFDAKWGPPVSLEAPLEYYSTIFDGDEIDTDCLAKVENDFIPCFAGEELHHYTWYFGDIDELDVHDGDEVIFRHRATGEIISRGHVTGCRGDWEAEMEHPAGTVCHCDIEKGSDIDLIIRTSN